MPRTKKTETAAVETTAAVSVKKTTAKKACKKAVTPDNFVIQSNAGQSVTYTDVVKRVNAAYDGTIESLDIYVKAEDGKAYYVINGGVTGAVDLF